MSVLRMFLVVAITLSVHQPVDEFSVGETIHTASVASVVYRLLCIRSAFPLLPTLTEI